MIAVVEFTHPGKQMCLSRQSRKNGTAYHYTSGTSGVRYWNCERTHQRKFIRSWGKVDGKDGTMDLLFWGEWEAQAEFDLLDWDRSSLKPNAVYRPLFDARQVGVHNTDPNVFSSRFYYSNCKQRSRRFLRELDRWSVILFGSEYDAGFALDTVFVVGKGYSRDQYVANREHFPELMRATGPDHMDLYRKCGSFSLYEAMMHSDAEDMFSFVPCRPYEGNEGGFPRPLLDYGTFGLQSPGARTVCTDLLDGKGNREAALEYWDKVRRRCMAQGYEIGIRFDEPDSREISGIPTF